MELTMTPTEKLRKRIGELMTENEVIKANSIVIKTARAIQVYGKAKRENEAYKIVLEELDKIESEVENG